MSYSCTPNMRSIILSHNTRILNKKASHADNRDSPVTTCNCRRKDQCVLDNKCLSGPVVYKAEVVNKRGEIKEYIRSTKKFKERY